MRNLLHTLSRSSSPSKPLYFSEFTLELLDCSRRMSLTKIYDKKPPKETDKPLLLSFWGYACMLHASSWCMQGEAERRWRASWCSSTSKTAPHASRWKLHFAACIDTLEYLPIALWGPNRNACMQIKMHEAISATQSFIMLLLFSIALKRLAIRLGFRV